MQVLSFIFELRLSSSFEINAFLIAEVFHAESVGRETTENAVDRSEPFAELLYASDDLSAGGLVGLRFSSAPLCEVWVCAQRCDLLSASETTCSCSFLLEPRDVICSCWLVVPLTIPERMAIGTSGFLWRLGDFTLALIWVICTEFHGSLLFVVRRNFSPE